MAKPSYATRIGVEALGAFGFFFLGFMGIAASVEIRRRSARSGLPQASVSVSP